ncbi:copper homeostasis protein CutC [Psychrilyobacter atlanticus]|uniref:copper homeostasis protein CutC n=1 Tax=Psychrilyobacter atlanticus TaxID=271091 RepID=UPI00040FE510|nr:copper homeostasis protein CutC [Psychrilyobacter atlanticus]
MIKEACVGNFIEAKKAEIAGAERIELCENLSEGGTTPSYGTVKKVLEEIKIPVLVMIRPRGGDFCYTSSEIDIMIEDIRLFKKLGIKGIVLGVLTKDNKIDYPILKRLLKETKGMEVTFHKAIDDILNPADEIEKLIELGIDRILSSGGATTALEGKETLNQMIHEASGQIKIVVAGGVTRENFEEVRSKIPSTEFHGKKIVGDLNK